MNSIKLAACMLATVSLLSACSDSSTGGVSSAPSAAAESKDAQGRTMSGINRRSAEGREYIDFTEHEDSYHYGDKLHRAFIDAYWSKSENTNKEVLAMAVSEAFAAEKDPFKRQEMLTQLEPKLNAYLENVRKIGDIAILTDQKMQLKPYNLETKGFDYFGHMKFPKYNVRNAQNGNHFYHLSILKQAWPDTMTKGGWATLKVSEDEARRIESLVSPLRNASGIVDLKIKVKGYIMFVGDDFTAQGGDAYALVAPDAFELVNPYSGETLVTLSGDQLPSFMPISRSDMSDLIGSQDVLKAFYKKYDLAD
jgi:hypothetical protein